MAHRPRAYRNGNGGGFWYTSWCLAFLLLATSSDGQILPKDATKVRIGVTAFAPSATAAAVLSTYAPTLAVLATNATLANGAAFQLSALDAFGLGAAAFGAGVGDANAYDLWAALAARAVDFAVVPPLLFPCLEQAYGAAALATAFEAGSSLTGAPVALGAYGALAYTAVTGAGAPRNASDLAGRVVGIQSPLSSAASAAFVYAYGRATGRPNAFWSDPSMVVIHASSQSSYYAAVAAGSIDVDVASSEGGAALATAGVTLGTNAAVLGPTAPVPATPFVTSTPIIVPGWAVVGMPWAAPQAVASLESALLGSGGSAAGPGLAGYGPPGSYGTARAIQSGLGLLPESGCGVTSPGLAAGAWGLISCGKGTYRMPLARAVCAPTPPTALVVSASVPHPLSPPAPPPSTANPAPVAPPGRPPRPAQPAAATSAPGVCQPLAVCVAVYGPDVAVFNVTDAYGPYARYALGLPPIGAVSFTVAPTTGAPVDPGSQTAAAFRAANVSVPAGSAADDIHGVWSFSIPSLDGTNGRSRWAVAIYADGVLMLTAVVAAIPYPCVPPMVPDGGVGCSCPESVALTGPVNPMTCVPIYSVAGIGGGIAGGFVALVAAAALAAFCRSAASSWHLLRAEVALDTEAEPLGRSSYAIVWRGTYRSAPVAVKTIHGELARTRGGGVWGWSDSFRVAPHAAPRFRPMPTVSLPPRAMLSPRAPLIITAVSAAALTPTEAADGGGSGPPTPRSETPSLPISVHLAVGHLHPGVAAALRRARHASAAAESVIPESGIPKSGIHESGVHASGTHASGAHASGISEAGASEPGKRLSESMIPESAIPGAGTEAGRIDRPAVLGWRGHCARALRAALCCLLRPPRPPHWRLAEVSALVRLRHPRVVGVLGAIVDAGPEPALVMELAERGSLRDVLRSPLPIDADVALGIARDTVAGLAYLHASGVVHGSVKASHVLLDPAFQARVSGFGLTAKQRHTGLAGEPTHCAPEILRGGPPSMPGDVYAFGILLAELFSREDAYSTAGDLVATLDDVADPQLDPPRRPDLPPDLPASWAGLIHACVHPSPALRPTFAGIAASLADGGPLATSLESVSAQRAMLPPRVGAALRSGAGYPPTSHPGAAVYFATADRFGALTRRLDASQMASLVGRLHSLLDSLVARHGLWRVETTDAGGSYLCAGNVHESQTDGAGRVAAFALEAARAARAVAVIEGDASSYTALRAGVAVGMVTAAVVGKAAPRFCVFGEAVALAQRLEKFGEPGRVLVSAAAAAAIAAQAPALAFGLTRRGHIAVQGQAHLKTLWLRSPGEAAPRPAVSVTERIEWAPGELLGKGAFGRVYLGLNKKTGDLMAVKIIDVGRFASGTPPNADHVGPTLGGGAGQDPLGDLNARGRAVLRDLRREIELCHSLRHKHVVRYIGVQEEEPTVARSLPVIALFLEFVPGGSLSSLLKKFGGLEERVARAYTRQMLLGLEYLHAQGVIHRDIKGGNVLVSRSGGVKLADLGAAVKLSDRTPRTVAPISPGTESRTVPPGGGDGTDDGLGASQHWALSMRGSVWWLSPEMIASAAGGVTSGYGRRTDIWSLGATVLEMLTCAPPWVSRAGGCRSAAAAAARIGELIAGGEMPALPPGATPDCLSFLAACFTVDPRRRPTAAALLQHAWVSGLGDRDGVGDGEGGDDDVGDLVEAWEPEAAGRVVATRLSLLGRSARFGQAKAAAPGAFGAMFN